MPLLPVMPQLNTAGSKANLAAARGLRYAPPVRPHDVIHKKGKEWLFLADQGNIIQLQMKLDE